MDLNEIKKCIFICLLLYLCLHLCLLLYLLCWKYVILCWKQFLLLLPTQIQDYKIFTYPLLSSICIFFLPCYESQFLTTLTVLKIRMSCNYSLVLFHSSFKITERHKTNTVTTEKYFISFSLFSLIVLFIFRVCSTRKIQANYCALKVVCNTFSLCDC